MSARRFFLRAAALAVLGLAIGGPAPGYVGNCSTDGGPGPVDRVQFCTNKEAYACARDLAFGRIDMTQYNVCSSRIDSMCAGFNFPPGCSPSQALANACISAVSDANRISTPTDMLVECQSTTLCGAASLEGI